MNIRIIGAHNIESQDTRYTTLLIDDVLAIDAGALASGLSFPAQQKLRAVLLTHQHYDHVRDIPALGMNFLLHENSLEVHATRPVQDALSVYLLNDAIYPKFMERPPEKPIIRFKLVEPGRIESISGYSVLPVTVNHAVPTVGYQVTSTGGKKVFYTSDTGPDLAECWRQVSPDLLIIEVTALNKYNDFARQSGHLTPDLLRQELESFRKLKGYLPQVVAVHMNPLDEKGIKNELAVVARALKANIRLGREGMRINI
jgi:ribonuclease BN (tRNA processing enzyme)